MCGQQICVLSQVDVWSTQYVCQQICYLSVLSQVDVWSTNMCMYLRWMCGQQICVLSQVDVWSTNMCIISGGCVVN